MQNAMASVVQIADIRNFYIQQYMRGICSLQDSIDWSNAIELRPPQRRSVYLLIYNLEPGASRETSTLMRPLGLLWGT